MGMEMTHRKIAYGHSGNRSIPAVAAGALVAIGLTLGLLASATAYAADAPSQPADAGGSVAGQAAAAGSGGVAVGGGAAEQARPSEAAGDEERRQRCRDMSGAAAVKCVGDLATRKLGAAVRAAIRQQ